MSSVDIATLRANLAQLNPKDQATATSLLDQLARRGVLSEAQVSFVSVLAKRALNGGVNPPAPRVRTAIGGLDAIMALFARAQAHLKQPSVVIGGTTGAMRLRLAGSRSRVPGSIDVLQADTAQAYGGNVWYGRILQSGEFEASPRLASPPGLVEALRAFAADPVKAAGAHAKACGRCMFCNLPIGEGDDPRARAVGYGEVCAKHWGLPFPSKSAASVMNTALFNPPQLSVNIAPAPFTVMVTPSPMPLQATTLTQDALPAVPTTRIAETPSTAVWASSERPKGVCAACYAAGYGWEEPCYDGTCYQCGGVIL